MRTVYNTQTVLFFDILHRDLKTKQLKSRHPIRHLGSEKRDDNDKSNLTHTYRIENN